MMLSSILKNEVARNTFWRALQIFSKQGVTILVFFMCAKLLTPYDFGVFNYLLAIILFLVTFVDFGLSTAVSKFTTEYSGDKDRLESLIFNSLFIILLSAVGISSLSIIFSPLVIQDYSKYIVFLLPLLFLSPASSVYDGVFRGLKRFKELAIISFATAVFSLIIAYVLVSNYGIVGALIAQDLFYFILCISLFLNQRHSKIKIEKELIRNIFSYSVLIGVADIGILIFVRSDVILLGLFKYIVEISYYELANKLFLFLVLPITIFSQVIAPDITKFSYSKNYPKIKNSFYKYTKYSFIFGVLISILCVVPIQYLLRMFMPEYNTELFFWYLIAFLIVLPIRMCGTILTISFAIPIHYAKMITKNNLVFGLINVFLSTVLIYTFGPAGVVISIILLSYTCVLVMYLELEKLINKRLNSNL